MKTKLKKYAGICLLIFILTGCLTGPANFTIPYNQTNSSLDQFININGCYVCPFGCDTTFYSVFTFYPDGLFRIATTSDLPQELINCFKQEKHPPYCKYPL